MSDEPERKRSRPAESEDESESEDEDDYHIVDRDEYSIEKGESAAARLKRLTPFLKDEMKDMFELENYAWRYYKEENELLRWIDQTTTIPKYHAELRAAIKSSFMTMHTTLIKLHEMINAVETNDVGEPGSLQAICSAFHLNVYSVMKVDPLIPRDFKYHVRYQMDSAFTLARLKDGDGCQASKLNFKNRRNTLENNVVLKCNSLHGKEYGLIVLVHFLKEVYDTVLSSNSTLNLTESTTDVNSVLFDRIITKDTHEYKKWLAECISLCVWMLKKIVDDGGDGDESIFVFDSYIDRWFQKHTAQGLGLGDALRDFCRIPNWTLLFSDADMKRIILDMYNEYIPLKIAMHVFHRFQVSNYDYITTVDSWVRFVRLTDVNRALSDALRKHLHFFEFDVVLLLQKIERFPYLKNMYNLLHRLRVKPYYYGNDVVKETTDSETLFRKSETALCVVMTHGNCLSTRQDETLLKTNEVPATLTVYHITQPLSERAYSLNGLDYNANFEMIKRRLGELPSEFSEGALLKSLTKIANESHNLHTKFQNNDFNMRSKAQPLLPLYNAYDLFDSRIGFVVKKYAPGQQLPYLNWVGDELNPNITIIPKLSDVTDTSTHIDKKRYESATLLREAYILDKKILILYDQSCKIDQNESIIRPWDFDYSKKRYNAFQLYGKTKLIAGGGSRSRKTRRLERRGRRTRRRRRNAPRKEVLKGR